MLSPKILDDLRVFTEQLGLETSYLLVEDEILLKRLIAFLADFLYLSFVVKLVERYGLLQPLVFAPQHLVLCQKLPMLL